MAERKVEWTDEQKRAIAARGSDVLVTASAGTGKTAVLSGRCASIVSDKSICPDVGSILVLTFTDAAAEQMRLRIAEQLRAAFVETKASHLRQQLMLLPGADISTIHSFCKRLITQYFYKLGLDPTFSVIDADEAKLLKAEVLEKTVDWAWQQSHLRQALEQLLYRRDLRTNDGFLAKIIDISDFLDGVVSRQDWYERAYQLAEAANPFTGDLGKKQRQIVSDKLKRIRSELGHAQKLCETADPEGGWAQKCQESYVEPVERCIALLESGNWDKCAEEIRAFSKPRISKPKELEQALAELIRKTVKKAIDSLAELSKLAVLNPDYLDRISGSASLQTKVLVDLVKKFDRLYAGSKQSINCLDFADLEHYALQLLTHDGALEDRLIPSETALALRRTYRYIFVDEYQDINPVQQAILKMLSSPGNVFVVGDVKQSIYAFRGAEPAIFIEDLKSTSSDPANAPSGFRVDLNANFRSAKGILDFVNKVFSRIMTGSDFAGIDYDESAQLRPAVVDESRDQAACDEGRAVEFHIIDEASAVQDWENAEVGGPREDESFDVVSTRQRQAAMIAKRVRQIVGADNGKPEFQIYDKEQGCMRDIQYRDIVVLMRSLAKKANDYVEVLRLAGIPVSCQATAGYFEATEINDMLCLLKVLDNPQRDIELAAVLRSPFFNVSDSELAQIRLHSKAGRQAGNFYADVLRYCECGPDSEVASRLKEVLDRIEQWRAAARQDNLADLIWRVYRQTGFLSFVSALPNGQARRANLLKLHDRAIQFEGFASSGGVPSLTRFVQFIERLLEVGQDWAPAEPENAAGNAVRVLSVHKSKGLEFPVVFLAELQSRFNKKDINADIVADAGETLGLQIIDREFNSKLRSLAHQVIAEQKLSKALAEEMRILYVATTRARDRLILTASQKQKYCREIIYDGFFFGEQCIADWRLRDCQSPLDWILYGLSDQKSLQAAFKTCVAEEVGDSDLFTLRLHGQEELQQLSKFIIGLKKDKLGRTRKAIRTSPSKGKESKLLSRVKKSLSWRYKFGCATLLPAKDSVTQLTHRSDEYVRFDYSRSLDRQPAVLMVAEPDVGDPLEARLIGTATHLVISQLDLGSPVTKEVVEKRLEKLLADGAITEAVAKRVHTESILEFFQSDLGRLVFDTKNTIWREWLFTLAMPAFEFTGSSHERRATSDETIVVQGIIDMLIQTPQGLVVVDFKTDNVTTKQVMERAKVYRLQMDLYGRAARAIVKDEVRGKWLYFLRPRAAIRV